MIETNRKIKKQVAFPLTTYPKRHFLEDRKFQLQTEEKYHFGTIEQRNHPRRSDRRAY